nr:uncharacterized protein LOC117274597 [Nicotiana tomentosiformis]
MDEFRESQKERVQEALDMGELKTSKRLNQELGLSRACDTRWGSHFKSFNNFILMFCSILDVLESLVLAAHSTDERAKAMGYLRACQIFEKIMRTNELYSDDFDEFSMGALENQLASYIINVSDVDERFSDLHGLCDLLKRLVQTKKHSNYPRVFRLVKLALLLPVSTASVERAFSAMNFIKNDLRSQMNDEFFKGCLVPYVEKNMFDSISNDAIIKTFQDMKPRRVQL